MKVQLINEYHGSLSVKIAYLVTTDHYFDFIEVDEPGNTLSSTIAITENGLQFFATEYKRLPKIPNPAYNKFTLLDRKQREIGSLGKVSHEDSYAIW